MKVQKIQSLLDVPKKCQHSTLQDHLQGYYLKLVKHKG